MVFSIKEISVHISYFGIAYFIAVIIVQMNL